MELFSPSLDFLSPVEKTELFALCTERSLDAGTVLFDYGSPAQSFFFLREGRLAVHKFTGFREKMQVIALLDPGTVAGEGAMLQGHCRKSRMVAIEKSLLYCLDRKAFLSWQKDFPVLASQFVEYLLSLAVLRLEKTSERLARIL